MWRSCDRRFAGLRGAWSGFAGWSDVHAGKHEA
jgi:hypothetical protein